ncbi:MAG: hypothetical protein AAFP84_00855 [Actinomycetota bacterium]
MSVQAWFSNEEVELEAGSSITLQLSVQNLGERTESYTIVPSGLTANWVNVERGNVTLFAGSADVIDVEVAPPQLPTTTAGPTVVGVRIIPTDEPDASVNAETTLDIQPFDDRRIVALHPVVRARRRASLEFMVENHGNGLASCRLRLVDPSGRIDGSFDPPAVGVAPGGSSLVRFRAKARSGLFRRSTRTLDFEVEAEQPGHDPASESFALIQPPTISAAGVGRVAAVLAVVGGAIAAWFGLVRPTIEDRAEEAVDDEVVRFQDAIDELGADIDLAAGPSDTDDDSDSSGPALEAGDPEFVRLAVTPVLAETQSDSFSVAEGRLFDLTDVRIENTNDDSGRASLAVNGDEVYVWSLENIRGALFEPRITPIRLRPGDNVTFTVRCDNVGSPSVGTCASAVNLSGRSFDGE